MADKKKKSVLEELGISAEEERAREVSKAGSVLSELGLSPDQQSNQYIPPEDLADLEALRNEIDPMDARERAVGSTLVQAMGVPGSQTRTAVRALKGDKLTGEDVVKGLSGGFLSKDGAGAPELETGYGPIADFGANAVTDWSNFTGAIGALKNLKNVPGLMNKLKMMAKSAVMQPNPGVPTPPGVPPGAGKVVPGWNLFSTGMQHGGKKVFQNTFKKSDARLEGFKNSAEFAPNAYSEFLWNNGQPRVTGRLNLFWGQDEALKNMGQQIEGLRHNAWDKMASDIKLIPNTDVAPGVTQHVRGRGDSRVEQVKEWIIRRSEAARRAAQNKRAATQSPNMPGTAQQVQGMNSNLQAGTAALRQKLATDPNAQKWFERIRRREMDAARRQAKEHFKRGLKGEEFERAETLAELKRQMPHFSGFIDEIGELYRTGAGDDGATLLNDLIDDGMIGPRTGEETYRWGQNIRHRAAGSDSMRSNAYKRQSKVTKTRQGDQFMGSRITDLIENRMEDQLNQMGENLGTTAKERFRKNRKEYSLLARGGPAVEKQIEQAIGRPFLSAIDALLLPAAGANPVVGSGLFLKKLNQMSFQNPAFGTALGKGIHDAGKLNVWDNMARQILIDSFRNKDGTYDSKRRKYTLTEE